MKSVLIIDDDRTVRTALSTWLTSHGWRVLEAEDGELGLKLAAEQFPDIVICDLLMPRCNGFQVCRALRQRHDHLSKVKIIVTTGSGYASDRDNALESGADEFLVKPVVPTELSQIMQRICADEKPDESAKGETASTSPAKIKFWGVRGSIPTPGPDTVYYGGNTACIEVRSEDEIIILDAGTGIRPLGLSLKEEFKDRPINVSILITHTHWDHIQGFPFFLPAYMPHNQVRVLGFEGARQGLQNTLSLQMESTYFPISLQQMPGNIRIEELKEMDFHLGKVRVRAELVNHPGICSGYRVYTTGGSVCYLPDIELTKRQRETRFLTKSADENNYAKAQDAKLAEFVRGSEVLIIDSQYDVAEYESHVGWGHSCIEDSVALALEANVRRLYLFHHDPLHNDQKITSMVEHARSLAAKYPGQLIIEAAREGVEIFLEPKTDA